MPLVHIRDGPTLLPHTTPGYTITETLQSSYMLLIVQAADGYALGTACFDDGESIPPTPHRDAQFHVETGQVRIESSGTFGVGPKLLKMQAPSWATSSKGGQTRKHSQSIRRVFIYTHETN
ncbi:uncharacterized protein PHACADRAFT_189434 [Phanerochaete carnosa HHB-10118-sp]|uniref:Uncharacterized protein n=1 Tax=Phanerochaete carnosa (strain HHB-10118-sp) TaxID=650164 RepID=K5WMB1_PHACS|nr:uncharacterized protein PHACADRAFT_189434 [Phanerochaete carnosa HHB-10118-sp]EKM60294.1 hypothetical protein PHACADRAFT_189434 [Phanerochaete carnosa HHB-10118-sp]